MRVTSSTYSNFLSTQLGTMESNQGRLQAEVSTGLRVQLPEDDANAMQSVMDSNAQAELQAQYQKNISSLQGVTTASASAMQSLQAVINRASEIATSASGVTSPKDLASYSAEVTQLIQQATQIANSQYNGSYLFSGTKTDTAPFALSTDASGNVTSVNYQGNQSITQAEIARGVTVSPQTLGANNTGTGPRGLFSDSRVGADLFNHLIALQNDLKSGNLSALQGTDNQGLIKDGDNLAYQIGSNGAVQSRLQAAATNATSQQNALNTDASQKSGADLTQTLLQLSQTQTAFQAALQTGGQILKMSLLNYLQ